MKKALPIFLLFCSILGSMEIQAKQFTTIHNYNTALIIKSPSRAEATYYKKWTVYSSHDIEDAVVEIYYSPAFKIRKFNLEIQKHGSNEKVTVAEKEFSDVSVSSGFEINDVRALVYSYSHNSFPITMELEYTVEMKGLVYFPDWLPLAESNMKLENARLDLVIPAAYKIGIKEINLDKPEMETDDINTSYKWEITKTLGPFIHEVYSPPLSQDLPRVMLRPGEFEYEKSKGNMETWKGMGIWASNLASDRTKLDKKTREFLLQNFGHLETTEEKVKKVYEWVQSKCRYVSVQLGIGGWQPEPAKEVDKKAYGDCKGLSNFTKAALAELNIKADYCLVYSHPYYDKCDPDFPAIQSFNHAILRVILPHDTLWLECTSSKTPYDGITPSIAGKYTLIVDGENSRLEKIPHQQKKPEVVKSKLHVKLNENNNADVSCEIQYSDVLFYDYLYAEDLASKDQRTLFDRTMEETVYKLKNCSYQNLTEERVVECNAEMEINSVWRKFGEEIFYSPVTLKNELPELPANPMRYNDLIFHRPYEITDTSILEFPMDFNVSYLPEDTILSTKFGKTNIFYIIDSNNLKMVSAITISSARYAASEYEPARQFLLETKMLMDRKVIFKKAQ